MPTVEPARGPLRLNPEELVTCVGCGLCLAHCPTYRVTGLEIASPRGRIAAMRAVEENAAPISEAFVAAMDACVQCRGCDAACPSGVTFGHLMEDTRAALVTSSAPAATAPRWLRAFDWFGYRIVLGHHRVLVALSWLLLIAQRLRFVPKRFGLPTLQVSALRSKLDAPVGMPVGMPVGVPVGMPGGSTGHVAWFFTGCVMDAWQRPTHVAALKVLKAAGVHVALPMRGADCCGALHTHAGRREEARLLAHRVIASMPGGAVIIVDSAGCGAALKEYGRLLDTAEARDFAARVRDFSEYVVEIGVPAVRATGRTVVVQDPCHLRHVQKAHLPVRTMLQGAYSLLELDDDGLCCGAGGAYSMLQPALSGEIRERKAQALHAIGAANDGVVVCSANPGCAIQLAQAGFTVCHPAELLAEALEESPR